MRGRVFVRVCQSVSSAFRLWTGAPHAVRLEFWTSATYAVSIFTVAEGSPGCQGGVKRAGNAAHLPPFRSLVGGRAPEGARPAGGGSLPGGIPHAGPGRGAGGSPTGPALGGGATPVEGAPAGAGALEVRQPKGGRPLPSLSSSKQVRQASAARGYRSKVAFRVRGAVAALVAGGPERVGFLTLTFPEDVEPEEASRRLHHLSRRVLPRIGDEWLWVRERTKAGRLHYHLLIRTHWNIREGFDFGQVKRRVYVSACPELRRVWALLRRVLPRYGFGRHELVPVRDRSAVGVYVGKYVTKSERLSGDRGQRLCGMTRGLSQAAPSVRFAWVRGRSWVFRRVVGYLESVFRGRYGVGEALPRLWGPRWSWRVIRMVERSPRVVEEALAWWGA